MFKLKAKSKTKTKESESQSNPTQSNVPKSHTQDGFSDWESREWLQEIQRDVLKITHFLNKFQETTHSKMSLLNSKLFQMERQMDYLEAKYAIAEQMESSVKSE
eukprot:TRINITY_DN3822_c0_g2_i2.p1 TRINITY_DN3822_c0_g2~~TRINITY_DN3822_c0_g2_i2.p1  ORF type:complete len:104 (-),score=8.40 TRINITY_DN3822_c0_g2_i2:52-363(-)